METFINFIHCVTAPSGGRDVYRALGVSHSWDISTHQNINSTWFLSVSNITLGKGHWILTIHYYLLYIVMQHTLFTIWNVSLCVCLSVCIHACSCIHACAHIICLHGWRCLEFKHFMASNICFMSLFFTLIRMYVSSCVSLKNFIDQDDSVLYCSFDKYKVLTLTNTPIPLEYISGWRRLTSAVWTLYRKSSRCPHQSRALSHVSIYPPTPQPPPTLSGSPPWCGGPSKRSGLHDFQCRVARSRNPAPDPRYSNQWRQRWTPL